MKNGRSMNPLSSAPKAETRRVKLSTKLLSNISWKSTVSTINSKNSGLEYLRGRFTLNSHFQICVSKTSGIKLSLSEWPRIMEALVCWPSSLGLSGKVSSCPFCHAPLWFTALPDKKRQFETRFNKDDNNNNNNNKKKKKNSSSSHNNDDDYYFKTCHKEKWVCLLAIVWPWKQK